MRGLRELIEDLIDPPFLEGSHHPVRVVQSLYFSLLLGLFRFGLLHGLGVEVLADG